MTPWKNLQELWITPLEWKPRFEWQRDSSRGNGVTHTTSSLGEDTNGVSSVPVFRGPDVERNGGISTRSGACLTPDVLGGGDFLWIWAKATEIQEEDRIDAKEIEADQEKGDQIRKYSDRV